jgi:uncharacterized membrane protein
MELYINIAAEFLEALGIAIIALGTLWALIRYGFNLQGSHTRQYHLLRQEIGKAILLGLEVLVGADIVATVVTEPTMNKVLILGVIVLIRTFLSFSLEVELDGTWPWKKNRDSAHLGEK